MDVYRIIGREKRLFAGDVSTHSDAIDTALRGSRVLLLGGAGSIGKEVAAEVFRREPAALHVIDISENNLVELVRHLRSSQGYTGGDTRFLPLDMASLEAEAFLGSQEPYDYVLNIAAMKHVRSEKDAFSLMRMVKTNVLDTLATLTFARAAKSKKYFAVSTDKAKNPANLMGATKRIMEDVLFREQGVDVSTARFANVAFSDGSLLHGFRQRLALRQPLAAPRDVKRYFMTGTESALLCLASLVLGRNREIFFPRLDAELTLLTFATIAVRFLESHGYEACEMPSEDDARRRTEELIAAKKWPCFFFDSDTAGEKPFEEFHSDEDIVDWDRFLDIGAIERGELSASERRRVEKFLGTVYQLRKNGTWTKPELVSAIQEACPDLSHIAAERSLDEKM